MHKAVIALAAASAVAGCASSETVAFRPKQNQEAMIHDGQAALVSRRPGSIVMVRPASRQFQSGARPVFVVGINNLTGRSVDFLMTNVAASQVINAHNVAMKVFTYDELVTEERNKQIMRTVLMGVAAGANAYSASQAGHYSRSSTVTTPRGNTYRVETTGYSPTANAIAQNRAAAQNEAMISATIEQGQANLAVLEQTVLKDNTLFPGEWYGGQLHVQAPERSDGPKNYMIVLTVGSERHEVEIAQTAVR
jgi:hypothetical protein